MRFWGNESQAISNASALYGKEKKMKKKKPLLKKTKDEKSE